MRVMVGSKLLPLIVLFAVSAHAYEEPVYSTIHQSDDYEIRDYRPYLVAETTVSGDFKESGDIAFRRLAGYIFGDNRRRAADTTESPSLRMNMTVPVTRHGIQAGGRVTVYRFVMERAYDLDTLPVPNSAAVKVHEIAGGPVAVLRYRGRISEARFLTHVQRLRTALKRDHIDTRGEPLSAVYNGPFTPPFLRRNEVLIRLVSFPTESERQ